LQRQVERLDQMRLAMMVGLHALLFVLAVLVFYLGLGIGLAFSPLAGAALWLVAGAIALANVLWLVGTGRRMRRSRA